MIYLIGLVFFIFGVVLYARSASTLQIAFKEAEHEGITLFDNEYKSATRAFADFRLVSKLWSKDKSIFTGNVEINRFITIASKRIRQGFWLGVSGGLIIIGAQFYYVS